MRKAIFALVALAVACNSPTGPVQITSRNGALQLTNATDGPVFYTIIESETAARVDWAPCVNPSVCPYIAPHQQRAIPYAEITGYHPGAREAIVYWWHLEAPADAYQPDSIRATRVRLAPGA